MQQRQPETLVICVFFSKIKCKDVAQAVPCKCTRLYFAAFDALDRPGADFTVLSQFFLRQPLLLPEFGALESEVGLVHVFLLVEYNPIVERSPKFTMSYARH